MPAPISFGPTRFAFWPKGTFVAQARLRFLLRARLALRRAARRSFITTDGNQAPIARWGVQVATAIRPSEAAGTKEYGRDPRDCRFGLAYRFVFFPRGNPRQQARRQAGGERCSRRA